MNAITTEPNELQALLRALCAAHGVETLLRGLADVCSREDDPLTHSLYISAPYELIAQELTTFCDKYPLTLPKATFARQEDGDLLQNCLDQFQALDNACTFTRSFALRNRLRSALNLPLEAVEETPEAPLCSGCGNYEEDCCCEPSAPDFNPAEEYEANPYDGTYSEV